MSEVNVAVVIVTYKCAALTIDALRSVNLERATSRLSIRAVVVDNASGDLPLIAAAVETNGWASWLTLIEAPRNGGFAYGNNVGFAQIGTRELPDYVYLLNPDAQVRPGGIASLVKFLGSRPDVGVAGSCIENLDGSDWNIAFRFPTIFSEVDTGLQFGLVSRFLRRWTVARVMPKYPQRVDWICGASMMIRWSVLTTIGGMDENYFLYFEETDFCRRAELAGYSTWYVPESRVMHIMGQSTGITDPKRIPKRLPSYWFESRSRYYAVTFGLWRAMVIDIVAVAAGSLGFMKRLVLRRLDTAPHHFVRDLIRHSVLWRRNRCIPDFHSSFRPKQHRMVAP
jgi:hypothetical protein